MMEESEEEVTAISPISRNFIEFIRLFRKPKKRQLHVRLCSRRQRPGVCKSRLLLQQ